MSRQDYIDTFTTFLYNLSQTNSFDTVFSKNLHMILKNQLNLLEKKYLEVCNTNDETIHFRNVMSEIEAIISTKLHERGSPRKNFLHYDTEASGHINLREFRDALQSLGIDLSDDQVNYLMKKYGDKNNQINYNEFINISYPLSAATFTETQTSYSPALLTPSSKVTKNEITIYPSTDFQEDIKKSGHTIENEDKNEKQCNQITYQDETVQVPESEADANIVDPLVSQNVDATKKLFATMGNILNELMEREGKKLHDIFLLFDGDHSGSVTSNDIYTTLLKRIGRKPEISRNHINHIISHFDETGNNQLSYHEFVKMVQALTF